MVLRRLHSKWLRCGGSVGDCSPRRARHRPSPRPPRSVRGLRRLLVFLGLVMANDASCGRSHQTVVARDVSGGTADDRTFDAALCEPEALPLR